MSGFRNVMLTAKAIAAPRCGLCGDPIEAPPGRGRRPSYCSASHRQRAYENRRLERLGSRRPSKAQIPSGNASGHEDPPDQDPQLRIENAARALLSEHGLEGTTMRAIARRAGVAYGTVSYHCGSKEERLLRVVRREGHALHQSAERTRDLPDVVSRRRSLRKELRSGVERQPDLFKLRFEMFALGVRNERYQHEVARMFDGARRSIASSRVRAGFREPDRQSLAPLLQGAIDGLALQHLVDPEFDHGGAHDVLSLLLGPFRRVRDEAQDSDEGS